MSRKNLPISAIIITYKSNRWIGRCLGNLLNGKRTPSEIIVIDNKSPRRPKTIIDKIKRKHQANCYIKYVENKKNLGFAKAANQGADISKGRYLLFINPDFFIDKNAIEIMARFAESKEDFGTIGGKVLKNKNKTIQKTIAKKPSLLTLIIEFTLLKKIFDFLGLGRTIGFWDYRIFNKNNSLPLTVDTVSGCFMLIQKSTFNKVGKFDEGFFLYLEDLDLGIRLGLSGLQSFFIPNALGKHISGASSISKQYCIDQSSWDKSKRYFVRKHFGLSGKLLSHAFEVDNLLTALKKKVESKIYA